MLYALDLDLIADIIEEFMTGSAPRAVTSRVLATVLFTDLVASTERAGAGRRPRLDRHPAAPPRRRRARRSTPTAASSSRRWATASWRRSPGRPRACAAPSGSSPTPAPRGLDVRSGLHTGEVERVGDDVAGLAVHLAARIMGLAQAGEILVSRTVRDLVVGSPLRFTDRGEHALKGIPEPWAVYAVE